MMNLSVFLANIFTEGGSVMMTLILICFLASLFFLIRGFTTLKTNSLLSVKMRLMAAESSLLGLVIGFFASILGLISAFDKFIDVENKSIDAFDTVEAMGNPNPELFAAGLKISLITATFGLLTFILVRIGILVLRGVQK